MFHISIGGEGGCPPQGLKPPLQWPETARLKPRPFKAFQRIVSLASIVLVLVSALGCSKDKQEEPTVGVQVVAVKKATIEQTVTSEAILFPLAQSAIVPKISAPVKAFYVNRGSKVRAGQLLAKLESHDLAAAAQDDQGSYDQAQAAYAIATASTLPEEIQKAQGDTQAAKLALEIRTIAKKHPDAVCTMGSVKTFPGIVTAVVGRCETTLDQRDLDAGVLARMYREAQEKSEIFAKEEGCTVEWSRIWNIAPEPFHPELIAMCEAAIEETAGRSHRLPSGPLHDAAEVSRAGVPTVMMFVQSLKGISHNKIEDTREDHLELAITAFDRLAAKTMDWIRSK